MQKGNYYKHEKGRDAVIYVKNSVQTGAGWLISATWHCTNFEGKIMGAEGGRDYFISFEDAQKWHKYDQPST